MKKFISMLLAMMLVVSLSSTAYAATPENDGSFTEFTTMQSSTVSGADYDATSTLRAEDYDLATCATSADLDRNFLVAEWRGQGHCTITPIDIFDPVTWDITLNVQLWKDGSCETRRNGTSYQTDNYTLSTKYVAGNSRDQFGVHVNCTVVDDNGAKIWDESNSVGNPFE